MILVAFLFGKIRMKRTIQEGRHFNNMVDKIATLEQEVEEEPQVAPEPSEVTTEAKVTTEAPLPAPPKIYSEAEYKGQQRIVAQRERELETTRSQLSALLTQGKNIEAVVQKIEGLEDRLAELHDRFNGVESQTTEEPAVPSEVARLQAERAARARQAQPQPMTEYERTVNTIKTLLDKAKLQPADPLLESVSQAFDKGDYLNAVEETRMVTNLVISASKALEEAGKALEEEGLSLSSDEAKDVREALKTGNTRKINRAVDKLIDRKIEEGNTKVEQENARKKEFKIITKSPTGSLNLEIPKDLAKRREWIANMSQEDFDKIAPTLNEMRRQDK